MADTWGSRTYWASFVLETTFKSIPCEISFHCFNRHTLLQLRGQLQRELHWVLTNVTFFLFLYLSPFVSFASGLFGQNSGTHRPIVPAITTDWSVTAHKKSCGSESVTTKIQHSVQPLFQIETKECLTPDLRHFRVCSMKTAGHQHLSCFNALENYFQQDAQKTLAWEAIANGDLNE